MAGFTYSRYKHSPVATDEAGRRWLVKRPRIARRDFPDNTVHIAISGEDCTVLAYLFLEDERHWWVIAEMNGIMNPLQTFEGGEQITIPSVRTLYGEILPAVADQ